MWIRNNDIIDFEKHLALNLELLWFVTTDLNSEVGIRNISVYLFIYLFFI